MWFWCYFFAVGFLHGVRGELTNDVSETAENPIFTVNMGFSAASETSSENLPRTPCKEAKKKRILITVKI
jgi:hypothetical protein